jgi:thioesterase domain-containing protein
MINPAEELQDLIRSNIPLSQEMQFSICHLDKSSIQVNAPLEPNVNIHGTGFAGSLYSLSVLTGWAMCFHLLNEAKIDASLVVSKAEIRYLKPVTGEIECYCEVTEAIKADFYQTLNAKGKSRLNLDIRIGDTPQAVLSARYVAIKG